MKRNFNNESQINLCLRAMKAMGGRTRGRLLAYMGVFATGSGRKLYFGYGPRFMNSKAIYLSDEVSFGIFARIESHQNCLEKGPSIKVGRNTSFGDYTHIGSISKVEIGDNVLGGSNILIADHSHGSPRKDTCSQTTVPPRDRELTSRGPIRIGNNVWIGDAVKILAGVTIGEGAIIPANSVVRSNVSEYEIFNMAPNEK